MSMHTRISKNGWSRRTLCVCAISYLRQNAGVNHLENVAFGLEVQFGQDVDRRMLNNVLYANSRRKDGGDIERRAGGWFAARNPFPQTAVSAVA